MRIKSIEPVAVSLPMKKPVQMAGETVARADNIFVRIESHDGVVGWGEAASAPTMTGETIAGMVAAVSHLTPGLIGRQADDFAGASAAMDARMFGNSGAKAAIEIALHDLTGRAIGRPLHALLGGKRRSRIPVLAVIGSEDADDDRRDAIERWDAGYRVFKIKVGLGSAAADAARTRAVCAALKIRDESCLVSADANQGFSTEAALHYVAALGDCGLDFLEQPVDAHALDAMARVAAATPIPIAADEGIHSRADIERHHERKAARGASLKAIKLGGLRPLLDAALLCERFGMQINISCKTGESSVASAAALHVAAVAPAVAWGLTVTNPALAADITADPICVDHGYVTVPDRPGLGIEIDLQRMWRGQQDFKRVA